MIIITLAIFVILCKSGSSSLYESNSPVVQLDASNFDKLVLNDESVWMVKFYASWCGHCKSLAPEYLEVAQKLKGLIKIGSVDIEHDKKMAERFSIRGYPTLKIFGKDKTNPVEYLGGRKSHEMISGILKHIEKAVSTPKKKAGGDKPEKEGDVYFLTGENFDKFIQSSQKPVLVMFFAPWCGHCTSMTPEFKEAATKLKDIVILAKLDVTVENVIGSRYEIKGFPTLKLFTANSEGKLPAFKEYNGGRTSQEIIDWATIHVGYQPPVIEAVQVNSQRDFEQNCFEKIFCMLMILPPLEDSSDQERMDLLDTLNDAGTSSSGNNWGWVWVSGATVDKLETALNIDGLSYPILVGIHPKKKLFATLPTSFTKKNIQNFATDVKHGRAFLNSFKSLPKLEDSKPWFFKKAQQEL